MPLEIEITPSPLQKISEKTKHTQGKNYSIFSATFKKVLNLYVPFPLTLGLDHFCSFGNE